MADLKLDGLNEVIGRLNALPERLVIGSLRSGLRQGANLIRDQARANFEGAGGPNELTGALKASIRTTSRRGSPTRVVFNVVAGSLTAKQSDKFGAQSAFYALWVEQGHINRKLGEALKGGRRSRAAQRAASTSNTPAYPYMAPALRERAQDAIDMVVATISANLESDLA
ncbi:hypothetical protein [Rugamonas sp.]|uniref:hypothetical protein n=1 Tax=Rugamonas sp. TaxID=1926287 RepID=UPI0025F7196B|nr:hypothetical protein [Rugamonas sp.]